MVKLLEKSKASAHLVVDRCGEPLTSSLIMAKQLGAEHYHFRPVIDDYLKSRCAGQVAEIDSFLKSEPPLGVVEIEISGQIFRTGEFKSRGKTFPMWWLNEEAFLKIITLTQRYEKSSDIVDAFIAEFTSLRRGQLAVKASAQANLANLQWVETRNAGKSSRTALEDAIARLNPYAQSQGSVNFGKNFTNYTRMIYSQLFATELKPSEVRPLLSEEQLQELAFVERIACKAIDEGMHQALPYREIFVLAKNRVGAIAAISGKSAVMPMLVSSSGATSAVPMLLDAQPIG
jgi:hypothetical protein